MAFMEKDGFRLYYEDTGGNEPAVLFLHGAGGNHLSWWQQVPVFAEEYRCVTVDHRGFGQSPDTPGGPRVRRIRERGVCGRAGLPGRFGGICLSCRPGKGRPPGGPGRGSAKPCPRPAPPV